MATEEHRKFLDSVMAHVQNKTPKIFLLEGEGGSGKSFISRVVLAETRLRHNAVALGVVSSGLAAQRDVLPTVGSKFLYLGMKSSRVTIRCQLQKTSIFVSSFKLQV